MANPLNACRGRILWLRIAERHLVYPQRFFKFLCDWKQTEDIVGECNACVNGTWAWLAPVWVGCDPTIEMPAAAFPHSLSPSPRVTISSPWQSCLWYCVNIFLKCADRPSVVGNGQPDGQEAEEKNRRSREGLANARTGFHNHEPELPAAALKRAAFNCSR